MALADRTFAELVDLLAAREPTPGGGSAAALTGALAAALAEMAAVFAIGNRDAGDDGSDRAELVALRDRATKLRASLVELAEADTRSYTPVLAALALEHSDPERRPRLRRALQSAAEVPLAIAAAAAEVAELAAAAARAGNAHLVGDATAAAILAEAATRAAARLVELNLAESPTDARVRDAGQLAERACAARAAVLR